MSEDKQADTQSLNLILYTVDYDKQKPTIQIEKVLGGNELIGEESSKINLEDIVKQYNILDLFTRTDKALVYSEYELFNPNEKEKLSPHIYLIKKNYDNSYLLNILFTPYIDINISKALDEIEFMTKTFSGIVQRIQAQKDELKLENENHIRELKTRTDLLCKYYHWLIFEENSIREGIEEQTHKTMLTNFMMIKAKIQNNKTRCLGPCKEIYSEEDKPTGSICDCGGEIYPSPPCLQLEDISFVFPKGYSEIIHDESEQLPVQIFKLISDALMPREINLLLHSTSKKRFQDTVILPKNARWKKKSTNDIIKISIEHHFITEEDLLLFASIADSRYSDSRLISSMSIPMIRRDILNGLKDGYSWNSIIKQSLLNEWNISPFISVSKLKDFQKLEELLEINLSDYVTNEKDIMKQKEKVESNNKVRTEPKQENLNDLAKEKVSKTDEKEIARNDNESKDNFQKPNIEMEEKNKVKIDSSINYGSQTRKTNEKKEEEEKSK